MGMSMDAPLVTFGLSEEALQIQIVFRDIQKVASGKHPRRETLHHSPDVSAKRIRIPGELTLDLVELLSALFGGSILGIQRPFNLPDVLGLPADFLLRFADRRQSSVNTPGEPFELTVSRPPF